MKLNSKIPEGSLPEKWTNYKSSVNLVSPNNKLKLDIIVVGTGLAGASAATSLAELGYNVKTFCFQDSPRRAHSIAAQGGINAAKNYRNDGDSVQRLFYDTIKGGDYRSREANVYRLAEVSTSIIDQCVAQGVPFAREYGGLLDNRSFGGVQVSRTFYAKGQTGQQLLLGAYSGLNRQIATGKIKMYNRHEMLELVLVDGKARGIIARDLVTGEIERHSAHAVVLATGGYGCVFFLSTNALNCNVSAIWRAHKKGAFFANPCFTQIHPTCIPISGDHQSKLTLMSESLRNDGRVWVPKKQNDERPASEIPESERDYFLERRYPAFGNLVPRDIASRASKERCDAGYGVGPSKQSVFLDFKDAIKNQGEKIIKSKYGNLFEMYEKIVDENPYNQPMRIYPAVHYTMGGLWVDYNLMSTIPGLYVIGEANFSDHGANRLGASALMQGLADGYFVLPYTIGDYLSNEIKTGKISNETKEFQESEQFVKDRISNLMNKNGKITPTEFHKKMGKIMWNKCGMSRNDKDLTSAINELKELKNEFDTNLKMSGKVDEFNRELEHALRVEDFFGLASLMCLDARERKESCGGHFREEYQTEDGEAKRDDDNFLHVSAWEHNNDGNHILHKEEIKYEFTHLKQRSYK